MYLNTVVKNSVFEHQALVFGNRLAKPIPNLNKASCCLLITLTFTVQFKNVPEVLSLFCTFQLKQSKLEKKELDASFKNQSVKFEEIVEEMKLSRYLDKCLHIFSSQYSYSYHTL